MKYAFHLWLNKRYVTDRQIDKDQKSFVFPREMYLTIYVEYAEGHFGLGLS